MEILASVTGHYHGGYNTNCQSSKIKTAPRYQQSSNVYTLHLINECPLDIELMYETAYWIKH